MVGSALRSNRRSRSAACAGWSPGKPAIAHIVPSLSAYTVAMDKGATGAQVADVAGVPAVQDWM